MTPHPYLLFDGRCAEAFRFYAECLGGEVVMAMTYGGSPLAGMAPADWGDKILHATLRLGDQTLGGADPPPDRYHPPAGFAVTFDIDAPAEADRVFAALAAGGRIEVPIGETFWAARFGMLTDRFGIPWMINCGQADGPGATI
jgi:PhnB protein